MAVHVDLGISVAGRAAAARRRPPHWLARSPFCRVLFPHILRIALELFRRQPVEIDADSVSDLVGCWRAALLASQVVPNLIVELAVEPIIHDLQLPVQTSRTARAKWRC